MFLKLFLSDKKTVNSALDRFRRTALRRYILYVDPENSPSNRNLSWITVNGNFWVGDRIRLAFGFARINHTQYIAVCWPNLRPCKRAMREAMCIAFSGYWFLAVEYWRWVLRKYFSLFSFADECENECVSFSRSINATHTHTHHHV